MIQGNVLQNWQHIYQLSRLNIHRCITYTYVHVCVYLFCTVVCYGYVCLFVYTCTFACSCVYLISDFSLGLREHLSVDHPSTTHLPTQTLTPDRPLPIELWSVWKLVTHTTHPIILDGVVICLGMCNSHNTTQQQRNSQMGCGLFGNSELT